MNDTLKKRKELLEEGLISVTAWQTDQQNIVQKEIELKDKESELANLISESMKVYRSEELRNAELQWLTEKNQLDILKVSREQGKIFSPYNGKVLDVMVNLNQIVKVVHP